MPWIRGSARPISPARCCPRHSLLDPAPRGRGRRTNGSGARFAPTARTLSAATENMSSTTSVLSICCQARLTAELAPRRDDRAALLVHHHRYAQPGLFHPPFLRGVTSARCLAFGLRARGGAGGRALADSARSRGARSFRAVGEVSAPSFFASTRPAVWIFSFWSQIATSATFPPRLRVSDLDPRIAAARRLDARFFFSRGGSGLARAQRAPYHTAAASSAPRDARTAVPGVTGSDHVPLLARRAPSWSVGSATTIGDPLRRSTGVLHTAGSLCPCLSCDEQTKP